MTTPPIASPRSPSSRPPLGHGALLLGGLLASACSSEQGISDIAFDYVAVTTGDFDQMEDAVARSEIPSDLYEGYIFASVYSPDANPENMGYKSEQLFTGFDEDDDPLLFKYPATFVNSGTRGLGLYVYNDVTADDQLLTDPQVITRVQEYLDRKRVMVVSDWAYDLVEAAWPDEISFLNEDQGYDAAQVGVSDSVIAAVSDTDLADALGNDQLEISFDFSYWTVMQDVASDVDVYLRGDVQYRAADGQGYTTMEDVPLLVGFDTSRGRVLFSSFAWSAQRSAVTDIILGQLVDGFEASGSSADEGAS